MVNISKDEVEYIDANISGNIIYYYTVTAYDEAPNESGYSTTVQGESPLGSYPPLVNCCGENSLDTVNITIDDIYPSRVDTDDYSDLELSE